LKVPSRALLCQWVKQCWGEISSETIRGSFKSCGVTIATSGAEDDLIHCFKEGQPCADGKKPVSFSYYQPVGIRIIT